MALDILLIIAILLLIMANVHLYSRSVVARRQQESMEKAIAAERKATASLIRLASEEAGAADMEIPFLERYCDFTRRTMRVSGMAAFLRQDDTYIGAAVSGIFPPLADLPDAVRQQLLSHPKYHKQHIRKISLSADDPVLEQATRLKEALLFEDAYPDWLPASSIGDVRSLIVAPLVSRRETVGMALVVQDKDGKPLTQANGAYVTRLSEIAGICIDGMRVSHERIEQEHRLRRAQEEGMLQVTTGMVHNIGNAITVAQLITADLIEVHEDRDVSVLEFMLNDMMPTLQEHQDNGTLHAFLTEDQAGREYVRSMHDLLAHLKTQQGQDLEHLRAIDNKLVHISEIIDLQQRFVGELGTEEQLSLEQPLKNAITIISESAEKRGVTIHCELTETPNVLVDRTMLTQVFLNLLTNALQAFDGYETSEQPVIHLRTYTQNHEGGTWPTVEVRDNGCGIAPENLRHIFDLGFTTKQSGGGGRGLGLHFCQETIRKYGGKLEASSKPGKGSIFSVSLEV